MKVLVACEESQRVCMAFRKRGHEAYSCDIIEPSGGHPEWHILEDVLPLLNGNCSFTTMGGQRVDVDGKWDLIIAHPPCTDLAVSGARWFKEKRLDGRQLASIEFFSKFIVADCDRIAIENPVGIIGGEYIKKYFPQYAWIKKPTQIIQPYEYGHHAKKTTCLWLKGLPNLIPTNIVDAGEFYYKNGKKCSVGASADMARDENGKILRWNDPRTAVIRSRTFEGIADAFASQWG